MGLGKVFVKKCFCMRSLSYSVLYHSVHFSSHFEFLYIFSRSLRTSSSTYYSLECIGCLDCKPFHYLRTVTGSQLLQFPSVYKDWSFLTISFFLSFKFSFTEFSVFQFFSVLSKWQVKKPFECTCVLKIYGKSVCCPRFQLSLDNCCQVKAF